MRILAAVLLFLAAGSGRPGPGDVAPSFSLPSSTGKTIALAEFKGQKAVVLAFYPKAFTGG